MIGDKGSMFKVMLDDGTIADAIVLESEKDKLGRQLVYIKPLYTERFIQKINIEEFRFK